MSSRYGVSEGDVLHVMNEEMLTRDEAIHWLLEDFELMESQRRFDDKLDRLLQMFGVKEERSEAFVKREEESSASIRATTTFDLAYFSAHQVFDAGTKLRYHQGTARATTLPSIETEEAEGDMTQVEEETEDTLHDLCAKVELKQRADSLCLFRSLNADLEVLASSGNLGALQIFVELKAPRPPPTKFISTKTPSIVAQQKLLLETNQRTLITRISPIEEKWVAGLKDKIRLEDVDFNWKILGLHDKEVVPKLSLIKNAMGRVAVKLSIKAMVYDERTMILESTKKKIETNKLVVHWNIFILVFDPGKDNDTLGERVANYMQELQTHWDPGGTGNNLHRLEDKSNIKERGLLGTQLGCRWAKLVMFQSWPKQAQLAAYIYEQQQQALGGIKHLESAKAASATTAAATWVAGLGTLLDLLLYPSSFSTCLETTITFYSVCIL
ncbi:hypothetical protein OsJ_17478 [Oryza sativa Japonica Group]|uniref:Uncharacterized protein n=1 Tax=Oryza sativa subsp. japonica TaxID=39947 RepID=B9FN01_ORYSJ|nr:hypothetical protein OsJ_17478 [Oryza sativa Japonica Group]